MSLRNLDFGLCPTELTMSLVTSSVFGFIHIREVYDLTPLKGELSPQVTEGFTVYALGAPLRGAGER